MNKILRSLLIIILAGQCWVHTQNLERINHIRGTKKINGLMVTVQGKGQVDSLQYCGDDTGPFYLGYNYSNPECGKGSYTFTFSKPVNEIVVNLSALSHSSTYDEECRFYINGVHAEVKTIGKNNGCGEGLCNINSEGNILPCRDCTGSGVVGLKFTGPITTFTVECIIISGVPMGFVAGVWFDAKPVKEEITLVDYSLKMEETSAGNNKLAIIEGDFSNAIITIKDTNGREYPLFYRSVDANKIVLDLGDLRRGEFILEIKSGNKTETQKIIIY